MNAFRFSVSDLDGLYQFTQTFDQAIASVRSATLECQRDLYSPDCFAPRFNGFRVYARNPQCGRTMYLWCGLLYDPSSRMGLMIEMDQFSNQDVYRDAYDRLAPGDLYEIKKNEKHIKLFMPDARWSALCGLPSPADQLKALIEYTTSCMETFARAIQR